MSTYYEYLANTNIRSRGLHNYILPLEYRYLEISGRISGKTTRLANAVIEFMRIKEEEDIAVCCSTNREMNNYLEDKILGQVNDSGLFFENPEGCISVLSRFSRNVDVNVYFFLDEFCFFRSIDEYSMRNIANRTLYACSSISNSNDVNDVTTLVGYLFYLNDNNYQRYSSLPGIREDIIG